METLSQCHTESNILFKSRYTDAVQHNLDAVSNRIQYFIPLLLSTSDDLVGQDGISPLELFVCKTRIYRQSQKTISVHHNIIYYNIEHQNVYLYKVRGYNVQPVQENKTCRQSSTLAKDTRKCTLRWLQLGDYVYNIVIHDFNIINQ